MARGRGPAPTRNWWPSTPSPGCATAPSPTRCSPGGDRRQAQPLAVLRLWALGHRLRPHGAQDGLRLLFAGGLVPLSAEIVRAIEADDGERLHRRGGEEDNKTRLGAMDSLRGLLQRSEVASDAEADPRPAARHRFRPRPHGPVRRRQRWKDRQGDGRLARGRCSWGPGCRSEAACQLKGVKRAAQGDRAAFPTDSSTPPATPQQPSSTRISARSRPSKSPPRRGVVATIAIVTAVLVVESDPLDCQGHDRRQRRSLAPDASRIADEGGIKPPQAWPRAIRGTPSTPGAQLNSPPPHSPSPRQSVAKPYHPGAIPPQFKDSTCARVSHRQGPHRPLAQNAGTPARGSRQCAPQAQSDVGK